MCNDIVEIPGFHHSICKCGVVRSELLDYIIKQQTTADGYKRVTLTHKGIRKHFRVHRLVAELFVTNTRVIDNITAILYNIVRHKNGKKFDNHADNLEWISFKESAKR